MIDLLVGTFATFRLTRLITTDTIWAHQRDQLLDWLATRDHPAGPKIAEGLECPWCVSMYAAGFVVLAAKIAPRAWRHTARLLTFSALTGLLTEHA